MRMRSRSRESGRDERSDEREGREATGSKSDELRYAWHRGGHVRVVRGPVVPANDRAYRGPRALYNNSRCFQPFSGTSLGPR
jgi:hypothetical protein